MIENDKFTSSAISNENPNFTFSKRVSNSHRKDGKKIESWMSLCLDSLFTDIGWENTIDI